MGRRWASALILGGLWWSAVLRLALQPEQAGVVEGAVAAGGWGLSLLPVHAASAVAAGRAGSRESGGPVGQGRPMGSTGPGRLAVVLTRAWRRPRSRRPGSDRS